MIVDTYPGLDKSEPVLIFGDWEAHQLVLTKDKIDWLWESISKFRTLFSDLTAGDVQNFMHYVTEPYSIWLELRYENHPAGIVCFVNMQKVTDTDAHIVFFDRELKDKVLLCQHLLTWVFSSFPLERVSVDVPEFYFHTIRLVKNVGFRQEGVRRCGALIGGRWVNVALFGITRQEAGKHGIPSGTPERAEPSGSTGAQEQSATVSGPAGLRNSADRIRSVD